MNSTIIWEGRIHIGDEPGIYGNAHYSGLSMKFPLTVKNITPSAPLDDLLSLEFLTENVTVLSGCPGPLIAVRLYSPDPQQNNAYKWKETLIKDTDRILNGATSTVVQIPVTGSSAPVYISVAIEIDTDAKPGLYDDFLFTRLGYTNAHQNIYVSLGFKE